MNPCTKRIKFEYIARIAPKRTNDRYQAWLSIPHSNQSQDIEKVNIAPRAKSEYTNIHQNTIAYFSGKGALRMHLTCTATLKQSRMILRSRDPYHTPRGFLKYTKSEKYIEQTPELITRAKRITKGAVTAAEILYQITNWIKESFSYTHPVLKRGVRHLDLATPTGDCGEAGALFVAMCRAVGIPAINQTGFVMYDDEPGNMYEHGWSSVYLQEHGWIDIDPRAGNILKRGSRFTYVQNHYLLSCCRGFSQPLRPAVAKMCDISFWRAQGLPCSKNAVQVMQPLFYCTSKHHTFEDRVQVTEIKTPRSVHADRGGENEDDVRATAFLKDWMEREAGEVGEII